MAVTIGSHEIPNAEEKYVELNHGTTRYIQAGSGHPTILVHGRGYQGGPPHTPRGDRAGGGHRHVGPGHSGRPCACACLR